MFLKFKNVFLAYMKQKKMDSTSISEKFAKYSENYVNQFEYKHT